MAHSQMPESVESPILKADSRVGTKLVTIFFGLLAIGFAIAAIIALATNYPSAVFWLLALGNLAAAAVGWPWRIKKDEFVLEEDGLTSTKTHSHLSWSSIDRVTFDSKCCDPDLVKNSSKHFVQIYVDDSAVTLFSDDIAPGDLYQRLWNCVIQRHKPILNDTVLQKYCKEHLSSYDKERFLVTGLTKKRVPGHSVRAGGMLAILVATVFAIIAGATTDNSEIAIVYAVIGTVIFFAALLLAGIGAIRRNKDQTFSGGIVISPAGLALRNKTLKGEMKWRELLKVELAPSKEKPVGLRLKLAGVTILLLEEYQVPLWYLYRQINFAMLNPEIESTTGSMFVDTQATAKSADISNPYMPPPR